MPEQSDGRKPFRRNSSGAENGFRRAGDGGNAPRSGGEADDRGRFRGGDSRGKRSAEGPRDDSGGKRGFGNRGFRPGAEKSGRGYRERNDFRSTDRPGTEGSAGGERGRRDFGGRADRPGSDDRRFGTRGGNGRPDRGTGRSHEAGGSSNYAREGGPGGSRRRGGEGAARGADRRPPRPDEPDLPENVQASDLDTTIRRDLMSLDKGNAETVARHLAMAAQLLGDDPRLALAHARAARQRAGRIAVVRETAGVVAYHAGEWAEALSELRAARRMAGGAALLAVMADCERGLGRPERAIEIGRSDEARTLTGDEAIELRIVVAGARMDLGQYDQAVVTLQTPDLDPARTGSGPARLFYAYADALVAAGRTDEGLTWFFNAAAADLDGETDAEERAAELTGET